MERDKGFAYGQLGLGIFLLITGAVLLLSNFDIIDTASVWDFWPVIIIIFGIGKLIDARLPHEYQKAFWTLFIGTWFLIVELNLFGLDYHNAWPILLIGVGIGMLWKSLYPSHETAEDHCHGH
jgi:hypothetical protein